MLAIGTTIHHGRYRIERVLDRSEFGDFYQAQDLQSGRQVALKIITRAAPGVVAQFEADVEALAAVRHAAIPPVVDRFQAEGGPAYVCAHQMGESLEAIRARWPDRRVSVQAALLALLPALDGLGQLHAQVPPLLHRDIRPANIFVSPEGQVSLTNAGLAGLGSAEAGPSAYGVTTSGFSPPEQRSATSDLRADLYAVGATLYSLLVGLVPPPAGSRLNNDLLVPPRRLRPELSPQLEGLILRLLAVRPEGRPASAAGVAQELGGMLDPQICPSCQRENRPMAKFCKGCGAHLPMAVPAAALAAALVPPTQGGADTRATMPGLAPTTPAGPDPAAHQQTVTAPEVALASAATEPAPEPAQASQAAPAPAAAPEGPPPPDGGPPAPPPAPPPGPTQRLQAPVATLQLGSRDLRITPLILGAALLALVLLMACMGATALAMLRPGGTAQGPATSTGTADTQTLASVGEAGSETPAADESPTAAATPSSASNNMSTAAAMSETRAAGRTQTALANVDTAATEQAAAAQTEQAAAATEQAAVAQTEQAAATQTAAVPTATPTSPPPPTPAPAPPAAQLRFVVLNYNDDPSCISVRITGVNTSGWGFAVDGLKLGGAFNGGNARLCGLSPGQEVTISVYNANGQRVRGGAGVPSKGSAIMSASWR